MRWERRVRLEAVFDLHRFACHDQIEFAFLHAKDEEGVLAGLDMMDREEAVKQLVSSRSPCFASS